MHTHVHEDVLVYCSRSSSYVGVPKKSHSSMNFCRLYTLYVCVIVVYVYMYVLLQCGSTVIPSIGVELHCILWLELKTL